MTCVYTRQACVRTLRGTVHTRKVETVINNGQHVERWTCDQQVQILLGAKLRNNLGQLVRTYVPLSPSSITWYRSRGGDALRLGR